MIFLFLLQTGITVQMLPTKQTMGLKHITVDHHQATVD